MIMELNKNVFILLKNKNVINYVDNNHYKIKKVVIHRVLVVHFNKVNVNFLVLNHNVVYWDKINILVWE